MDLDSAADAVIVLFLLGTYMVFRDLVVYRDSTNYLIVMNDILVTSKRVSEELVLLTVLEFAIAQA